MFFDVPGRGLAGRAFQLLREVGFVALCVLTLGTVAPAQAAGAAAVAPGQDAGTLRMVARLEQIARETDPLDVRFLAGAQVPKLRAMLAARPELARDEAFRYRLAEALMNASRNAEARVEWEEVEALVLSPGSRATPATRINVRLNRAVTALREGEVLNCLSNHNADSCLLPIAGGGIHVWKEPSRQASGILQEMLVANPGDLAARWLLNLAAMTLGDYPQGVPARWLIPESAFASEIAFPRFREIAPAVGLGVEDISGGSAIEDFDGDELLDVAVTSIGLSDPMHLFRNLGNGQFAERTRDAGLGGMTGGLNLVQADYDNDGDVDLLVLRGAWMGEHGRHPNSLLRNRGDGTFDDVTEAAGLLSFHPTQTAVWFDFDGDGWLDLFIGNESQVGRSRHPNELYWNQGDGTFREMAAKAGVSGMGFVKGVASGDFNNDGRPDLYLSILGGRNRLYRNDGPKGAGGVAEGWVFTEVAEAAGVAEPLWSFPCWFFDYDNDGWEDLWVSGYRISSVGDVAADVLGLPHDGVRMRLYRNQGNGTFRDVSTETRLNRLVHTMGCNFGDLDNDGWLDFYAGTGDPDLITLMPNRMFRNGEGRVFQDVTTAGGFGHLQKGHG
ncbi:MAG: VCBS repeat-containing protein, partial [Verrucomicrobiales bacterium]|nr:VCBS repeat-containing protein [Verrucomicrobiales bacterium]